MYKNLYPEIIAQAVHSDFRKEMEDHLEFRHSEIYDFDLKTTMGSKSKSFFLEWTLMNRKSVNILKNHISLCNEP